MANTTESSKGGGEYCSCGFTASRTDRFRSMRFSAIRTNDVVDGGSYVFASADTLSLLDALEGAKRLLIVKPDHQRIPVDECVQNESHLTHVSGSVDPTSVVITLRRTETLPTSVSLGRFCFLATSEVFWSLGFGDVIPKCGVVLLAVLDEIRHAPITCEVLRLELISVGCAHQMNKSDLSSGMSGGTTLPYARLDSDPIKPPPASWWCELLGSTSERSKDSEERIASRIRIGGSSVKGSVVISPVGMNGNLCKYLLLALQCRFFQSGCVVEISLMGFRCYFRLEICEYEKPMNVDDRCVYRVAPSTRISLGFCSKLQRDISKMTNVTSSPADRQGKCYPKGLARLGGCSRILDQVLWNLFLPLLRPDMFHVFGVPTPKGLLLCGTPGSGKTFLFRAIEEELHLLAERARKMAADGNLPPLRMSVGEVTDGVTPLKSLRCHGSMEKSCGAARAEPTDPNDPKTVYRTAVLDSHKTGFPGLIDLSRFLTSLALCGETSVGKCIFVPPVVKSINGTELISATPGATERNISDLFAGCKAERLAQIQIVKDAVESRFAGIANKSAGTLPNYEFVGGGALLFIDEFEALCPRRESASEAVRRQVCTFLSHIDGVQNDDGLLVVAATNHPSLLDDAVRRAGRLECDIEVGVPSSEERFEILLKLLEPTGVKFSREEIRRVSERCQAFVPADMKLLLTTATTHALKEHATGIDDVYGHQQQPSSDGIEPPANGHPVLRMKHFERALRTVRPSAMKAVCVEVPHVRWKDIGGYVSVKKSLRECVEWPVQYGRLFSQLHIAPPRGVLLYGPPGCSKTMMAKAVATESNMNFISVKGPELFSKWVGESERAVRELFGRARQNAPCVIFFDEVDALGADRQRGESGTVDGRVLSQLLNEMDGVGPTRDVVVIAATNRPDLLDAALLRPGRFDRLIYVPLPDFSARREMAAAFLRRVPLSWSGGLTDICDYYHRPVDGLLPSNTLHTCEGAACVHEPPFAVSSQSHSKRPTVSGGMANEAAATAEWLAEKTEGYSGAEVVMVCREAGLQAIREFVSLREHEMSNTTTSSPDRVINERGMSLCLRRHHFEIAIQCVKPRTPSSLLQFYEKYDPHSKI